MPQQKKLATDKYTFLQNMTAVVPVPQMQHAAIVVLLMLLAVIICCCDSANLRLHLRHVDAGRGLTDRELLHRMAQRSKARATQLLSASGGHPASAPVNPGTYKGTPYTEYLVHFAVGTPPQPVQLTLDTGSDLVWTQCKPCPASACFNQTLPFFDPSNSSTFTVLPFSSPLCQLVERSCGNENSGNGSCHYTCSYGDNSVTRGELDSDTFTFGTDEAAGAGSVQVPGLGFGCGHAQGGSFDSNETGIAGFGLGDLSLPSQLKVDNFSHCFTTITGSQFSPVLLGLPANLYSSGNGTIQSTPFVPNPSEQPGFYYLSLKGITVGSTRLPISESVFALKPDGTGGTFIDSGTGLASLPKKAYDQFVDAFVSQLHLPEDTNYSTSVDLRCFSTAPQTKPDVPKVMLHFEGATLDLPRENYIFEDTSSNVICLMILMTTQGDDMTVTVIGNYQQQNMHVLYDLANNMLSFVPAQCDKI